MTTEPAFEIRGATVRFGSLVALDGVDLSIDSGERVAVLGPSGAGKTTLLGVLGASMGPDEGRVRVFGNDIETLGARALQRLRTRIGRIPQDLALVPNLRVARNVLMGRLGKQGFFRALASITRPSQRTLAEVHAILDEVGIADRLFERTDRLSLGQQQRVAIARALYQRPEALLADEPTANVDPARAASVLEVLDRVARQRALTMVVSLHDPDLARRFFDRIVGLDGGRVVLDVPSSSVDADDLATLYRIDTQGPESAER